MKPVWSGHKWIAYRTRLGLLIAAMQVVVILGFLFLFVIALVYYWATRPLPIKDD